MGPAPWDRVDGFSDTSWGISMQGRKLNQIRLWGEVKEVAVAPSLHSIGFCLCCHLSCHHLSTYRLHEGSLHAWDTPVNNEESIRNTLWETDTYRCAEGR
jgi:hypothetical protein